MEQRCKTALIGSGKMVVHIQFPEVEEPVVTHAKVTAYNAGMRDGARALILHAYITFPTPAAFIISIEVRKSNLSRYGLKLVGSVPKIAGGSGSVTHLGVRFRKGIFSATCPADRQLDTRFNTTFADGTRVSGEVVRACKQG